MWSNKPVVLAGLMDDWKACKEWVTKAGRPNFSFLSEHFGSSIVQVADCGERDFTDQRRKEMTVLQYLKYWETMIETKSIVAETTIEHSLLYLKDWHFVKEYPEYEAYTTPSFFSDDWLNEYTDKHPLHFDYEGQHGKISDYRFVYMGPMGTWTPLHADVLRSYSWSANVCGRKCWHLLSPEQTQFLYDRFNQSTVYDIYADISEKQFPSFAQTSWIECMQEKGEILFVPSGWYHQVTNMVETLSINHNWLNACNLHWSWHLLTDDYKETVASIEDIKVISEDFEFLCQRNLAANSGMNFRDFCEFIACMTNINIQALSALLKVEASDGDSVFLSKLDRHLFNLLSIQRVSRKMCFTEFFLMDAQVNTCCCSKDSYDGMMGTQNISFLQSRGISPSSSLGKQIVLKFGTSQGYGIAQCGNSQNASIRMLSSASSMGRYEIESEDDLKNLQLCCSSSSETHESKLCSSDLAGVIINHKALTYPVSLEGEEFFACLSSPFCILKVIQTILLLCNYISPDLILPEAMQIEKHFGV